MLLSAHMLDGVGDVNTWEIVNQVSWTEGDTVYVYFMLIDASKNQAINGFNPAGRRYIPTGATNTLTVEIKSVDDSRTYTKTATKPFTNDSSIWRIQIAAADAIVGTRDLLLSLVEDGVTKRGRVSAAISVHSQIQSY